MTNGECGGSPWWMAPFARHFIDLVMLFFATCFTVDEGLIEKFYACLVHVRPSQVDNITRSVHGTEQKNRQDKTTSREEADISNKSGYDTLQE